MDILVPFCCVSYQTTRGNARTFLFYNAKNRVIWNDAQENAVDNDRPKVKVGEVNDDEHPGLQSTVRRRDYDGGGVDTATVER